MTPGTPTLARYLPRWLADVVRPNLEPATYAYYETMTRLYIVPEFGARQLGQLQADDVRAWFSKLAMACRCCARARTRLASLPRRPQCRTTRRRGMVGRVGSGPA